MFIATVHKAERKTVVEIALVSSVIGIQSKGVFLQLSSPSMGPWSCSSMAGLELVRACFQYFACHYFIIYVQDGKTTFFNRVHEFIPTFSVIKNLKVC